MFVDIKSFFFDSGWNTQTVYFVENLADDVAHDASPAAYDDDTENLCTEESETASVECPSVYGEQTCQDGSKATAHAVYR